jgi:hypothetical protein
MSFQNPGAEKCQEGIYRELIIFNGLGEKWFEKSLSPRNSWTLFFFKPFLPHVWDSVFVRPLKIIRSLQTPS